MKLWHITFDPKDRKPSAVELDRDKIWNFDGGPLDPDEAYMVINPGGESIDDSEEQRGKYGRIVRKLLETSKDDIDFPQLIAVSYGETFNSVEDTKRFNDSDGKAVDDNVKSYSEAFRDVEAIYLPILRQGENVIERLENGTVFAYSYGAVRAHQQRIVLSQILRDAGAPPEKVDELNRARFEMHIGGTAATANKDINASIVIVEGVNDKKTAQRLGDNREPVPEEHEVWSMVSMGGNSIKIYLTLPERVLAIGKGGNPVIIEATDEVHELPLFYRDPVDDAGEVRVGEGHGALLGNILKNGVGFRGLLDVRDYLREPDELDAIVEAREGYLPGQATMPVVESGWRVSIEAGLQRAKERGDGEISL